jgi:hypothetical protein
MPLAFNPSQSVSSSGVTPWRIQSSDYTAKAGERILVDTSTASWKLTLPQAEIGDEIDLFGISGLEVNSLNLNLGQAKFENQVLVSLKLIKNDYIKLIYIGTPGWVASNKFNLKVELSKPAEIYKYNSLFTDVLPPNYQGNDNVKYHIGTQFKALVDGEVTGLRMWKSSADPNTSCLMNLWDVAGGNIINESRIDFAATDVGWVFTMLSTPVPIAANKEYIVSAQTMHYVSNNTLVPNGNHIVDKLVALKSVYANFPNYPSKPDTPTSNFYQDILFKYLAI